ncbi:MAG TPA: AAA family ATPase [Allocoleopsis sp.]
MQITQLEIKNFRGIKHLVFDFPLHQPAIFIGVNGVGKSSILDAIAILLSPFFGILINQNNYGAIFNEQDINNSSLESELNITVLNEQNQLINWSLSQAKMEFKKPNSAQIQNLTNWILNLQEKLQENPQSNLPLAVYYLTNRAVLDIPLRIRKKHLFREHQFEAYNNALIGNNTDFRIFFEWFREKEDLENEMRLDNNPDYRNPQLQAVRQAISSLIPDFSNLRVKRYPLRMTVQKKGAELIINQLSDGEKCLLAMVGDLARRLAIANPNLKLPLSGNAIVLIDEIDLHLHPKWQREIIPNLIKTFPNCQFIVTTHSPQVVSHVKEVYLCNKIDNEISLNILPTYGKDSNQILEVLMETGERPPEVQAKILQIFRLIEQGELIKVKELLRELTQIMETEDPILLKADVLIKRKEILNR